LRRQLQVDPGYDAFFGIGVEQENLRREIFFLAYHLHWPWSELMAMEIDERRAYTQLLIDQIERENAMIEASKKR